ncbi:hypothetical protein ISN45_Aa05g015590 [Arabidopsis thaliana x Arabidopsis arenosa]|uniref:Uncharacterized protein n=1 Tax=Arabidopsis thaliana x Arabidopsis arenosa TaxID=1240361 RepID=A0A8T1ZNJ1_9BRAS|nr:hypothetical protein ISN45_Aa05g015590 [Arabidopsis thaliana x Arabidopsis arenosa]KAG7559995.1 hypothetical protein ISN45_Aa05g015590 [Arabidopsis thaliana x Arabidopsis arenosa]
MASSSNVFKYPPRLYAEGKSPLQHRSMNHNCYLSKIGQIREGLGIDVWDELEKSSLGVFIKLAELEYTWAAKKVHLFFHEIWSMIDGRPVRRMSVFDLCNLVLIEERFAKLSGNTGE